MHYTLLVTSSQTLPSGLPAPVVSPAGTLVAIYAPEAPEGYRFDHWSGDLTGTDNPATVLFDRDKTVQAVYAAKDAAASRALPFCGAGAAQALLLSLVGLTLMRGRRRG